jgi:uncharacterized membrane protein
MHHPHHAVVCHVCNRNFPLSRVMPWGTVRSKVAEIIEEKAPGWQEGCYICRDDLADARVEYVERMLEAERGELSDLDRDVIDSLQSGQPISQDPADDSDESSSLGDRMADRVARFGGSWAFILIFAGILISWMTLNSIHLLTQSFDPYPFILLNLVLSSIAAFQAPIIMMSQRRQETKDRLRADNDYRVNLKAELEIRQLHEKLDHQIAHQWEKLAELQQIQIEALERFR